MELLFVLGFTCVVATFLSWYLGKVEERQREERRKRLDAWLDENIDDLIKAHFR